MNKLYKLLNGYYQLSTISYNKGEIDLEIVMKLCNYRKNEVRS